MMIVLGFVGISPVLKMRVATERRWRMTMKLLKTLQNPFALIFQGFIVGGLLFFTAHPFGGAEAPLAEPAAGSVISELDA